MKLDVEAIIASLKAFIAAFTPAPQTQQEPPTPSPVSEPVPTPTAKPVSLLTTVCLSIKQHEGWAPPGVTINGVTYPLGTPSFRHNNPGNCRYSNVGYLPIYGKVRKSPENFAIFKDYATGWLYLTNLVKSKVAEHPTWTIYQFFADYAPTTDGNDPIKYAEMVARNCGVSATALMKSIL